jgi:hypothetical protein
MRGIEAMFLATFAGLVGLGIWNTRPWLPRWSPKVVNSVPANADKAVTKLSDKLAAKKRHAGGVMGNGRFSGTSDIPLSETRVDVPFGPPVFPTRTDLPVGSSGVGIRAKYGEPTARVTEMHAGQLLERYYYFNSDRTQMTVATLEGGIITGAEAYREDRTARAKAQVVPVN